MISAGFERERARDAEALALAAGELERKALHRVGAQADLLEQRGDALLALLPADVGIVFQRLADDAAGRHARVERRIRILEHHLHAPAPRPHVADAETA